MYIRNTYCGRPALDSEGCTARLLGAWLRRGFTKCPGAISKVWRNCQKTSLLLFTNAAIGWFCGKPTPHRCKPWRVSSSISSSSGSSSSSISSSSSNVS
eukprot:8390694-Pyramimonas_sp.AAC.1